MISRKKLETEFSDLAILKIIIKTYEDIAAARMRHIKTMVLNNREFLDGLSEMFIKVKYSYKKEVERLMKKKESKGKSSFLIAKKKKIAVVFLSANTGLFGDIIRKTFYSFKKYIMKKEVDIVIVGRMGKLLLEEAKIKKSYKFFNLQDNIQTPEETKTILEFLLPYETIIVFHGRFKDILTQVPTKTYITGQELITKASEKIVTVKCVFEPDLKKLLTFFEEQILYTLFEQTLFESALSKFTSRMISLDKASLNIDERLKKIQKNKISFKHIMYNKKQSNILSGISKWRA